MWKGIRMQGCRLLNEIRERVPTGLTGKHECSENTVQARIQAIRAPSPQRRGHGSHAAGASRRFRASQSHEACTAVHPAGVLLVT